MIKLGSLSRWDLLPKGSKLTLKGDAARRIRLNVNSPKRASLYIVNNETGTLDFLASPDGHDVVEFFASGNIDITTDDEDVYIYTAENEPTFAINEDAEIFTKIAERAARNPDLEHLMYLQQMNMDRRFAQQQHEINQQIQEAYNAGKLANSQSQGAITPENDAGQSRPDTNGSASTEGTGQAPSGTIEPSTGQVPSEGLTPPAGEYFPEGQ